MENKLGKIIQWLNWNKRGKRKSKVKERNKNEKLRGKKAKTARADQILSSWIPHFILISFHVHTNGVRFEIL